VREGTGRRLLLVIGASMVLAALLGTTSWLLLRHRGDRGGPEPTLKVVPIEGYEAPSGPTASAIPLDLPEPEGAPAASPVPRRRSRRAKRAHVPPVPTAKPLPPSAVLPGEMELPELTLWPPPTATVFAGKRYKGRSQTFGVGEVPHLRGTRLGDNAASSLRLAGGARLTLYLKPGFAGRSETFLEDRPNLKGSRIRNNRASSLRVEPPPVGPLLWRAGPLPGFGTPFELERHRNAVVIRSGGTTTYLAAGLLPPEKAGLGQLVATRAGLARALGPPRSAAVRITGGTLVVQLFTRGVVVYSPDAKRGWYRLDEG